MTHKFHITSHIFCASVLFKAKGTQRQRQQRSSFMK